MCFVNSGTTVTKVPALQGLVQTVSGPGGNMIPATTATIDAAVSRANTNLSGRKKAQAKTNATSTSGSSPTLLTPTSGLAKKTLLGT